MNKLMQRRAGLVGVAAALVTRRGQAQAQAQSQAQAQAQATAADQAPLFLAQLSLGPGWDSNKPPQDQSGFREHSANLARLRRSGVMLFGARTKAKGWMILTASDLEAARREFADDPMVQREAFALELEPLMPFFRGALAATPTPPSR